MQDDHRDRSIDAAAKRVVTRRGFMKGVAGGIAAASLGFPLASCASTKSATSRRVIVLGLDGLDPTLMQRLIDTGRAPNFKKLQETGTYSRLGTTMPALSPVAWSSFITGLNPGGHGIADFIARDPKTYMPVFSIYVAEDPGRILSLGDFRLPLSGGDVKNLRKGKPFWAYLTEQGIPAVVVRIPTNFPVDETATRAVSGMGTPDLVDSYGMFNYYTTDTFEDYPNISGGNVHYLEKKNHRVDAFLPGPVNAMRAPKETRRDKFANHAKVPFTVHVDPERDLVRIDIQNRRVLLKKGEYSDWVRVTYDMLPVLSSVSGIARFLLKEAHPHLKLYVTPINIDPENQAMPVTHPISYGSDLARATGPFWTKGLPADTKAFDYRIINDEEYVGQAELLLKEQIAQFDYEWSRFRSGFLFYYISNTDQDAHMLWRNMDETHPMHGASDKRFAGYIPHLYEEMDKLVGKVLPALDENTLLLVSSDHGFAPFGRQFHLNSWLRDNGYLKLKPDAERARESTILDVDWKETLLYGVGFNGLYVNRKGREGEGFVDDAKAAEIVARVSRELEAITDPETGIRPIHKVYRREEMYSGDETPMMPEMLVGYTPGYRSSSPSVLGETGKAILDLNPWAWSGDHSMARDLIPGSLVSNRALPGRDPNILDLPVTILDFFGIAKPPQMVGKSLLRNA
ncbi:MAG: alkaline phosphatase family protein [Candidatus Eisenbacteria bacterium]|nr:alkaline phosphatase family protein [Candidatus Eisenbacteria bacterium]